MFDFFSLILVLFIIFAELAIGTAIFYIGLEIIVGIPMRIIFSLTGLVSGEVNNYKKKKAERYDTQDDLSQVKVRKNKNNYVQVESLRLHDEKGRDTLHQLMDKSAYPFDDTFLPDEDSIRKAMRPY